MAPLDPYQSCQTLVRDLDRDRYYATLFAPRASQKHLFALYAFNAEIAATREKISEPMPGEMRLQWWRDTLAQTRQSDNPIAQGLLQTLADYNLETAPLIRLIEARRFDLYDDPMGPLDQFEGYAGETCSILFQYAAMILNSGQDEGFADAAGHAGVAYALTGILRAQPVHSARRQMFLPKDILDTHGVSEKDLFAQPSGEGVMSALAHLANIARDHLDQAQNHIAQLPEYARPAFRPLALMPLYLERLETPRAPAPSQFRKIWQLMRAHGLK